MGSWSVSTASPEETLELGRSFGEALEEPAVILLSGNLGAGKTCFVQGLARGLGVPKEEPVTSPSFALMNQYHGRLELFHFDLYRLSSSDELLDLGMEEYLFGQGVAVVEWAERLPGGEEETLRISFDLLGVNERRLTFQAKGAEGEVLLERLRRSWQERGKKS